MPRPASDEDADKKEVVLQIRMERGLHQQAKKYAKEREVSLGALIRALLRRWTDPEDPRPLPPGIEREKKRPSRRSKKKQTARR